MTGTTGLRRAWPNPRGWAELAKFSMVGGSGYIVNLAVFTAAVALLDAHHLAAATYAFSAAVTSNFLLNRAWTFRARTGRKRLQAPRFFAVSTAAFVFSASLLQVLVGNLGVPELQAQATAIIVATPLNFVGNKLWTFGTPRPQPQRSET